MASNLIETTTTALAAATLDEAKEFPERELLELFQEEIRFFDFYLSQALSRSPVR